MTIPFYPVFELHIAAPMLRERHLGDVKASAIFSSKFSETPYKFATY
jgi:hypothetical protein